MRHSDALGVNSHSAEDAAQICAEAGAGRR
jgi:hypothetical protein